MNNIIQFPNRSERIDRKFKKLNNMSAYEVDQLTDIEFYGRQGFLSGYKLKKAFNTGNINEKI